MTVTSASQLNELVPPGPLDRGEAERWDHTRMRRRLLYSEHRAELEARLEKHIGPVRKQAWGPVDCSANPYLNLWEIVSRLYSEAPSVTGSPELIAAVEDAGLWSLMQRQQRDTLGLREMGMRVDIVDGAPIFSPVFSDLLEGTPDPRDPGQFIAAAETRWVPVIGWVRYLWDVTGAPSYTAVDLDGNDVSADVLGGAFIGDAYPYRIDGRPVVPVVLYHAAETARLWDAFAGREIVEGSWMIGIFRTYFGHVVRNCAWSQRYAVGVDAGGADVMTGDGGGARREITTDPATVTMFHAAEDGGQPLIGQWAPPILPDVLITSIARYEEMLVESAGLGLNVTRQSSDIRSGYSLAVARDAIREVQKTYEPLFRRSDMRLLRLTAALLGIDAGDLSIAYRGLPESPMERNARLDEVLKLRSAGLISTRDAFSRLNPHLSQAEVSAGLAAIGKESSVESDQDSSMEIE